MELQKIIIETSKGICMGYIATKESLAILAKDPDFNNAKDIKKEISWHASQYFHDLEEDPRQKVIFGVAATDTFSKMGLAVANFYVDNGWLKAELDDPHYGEAEWKIIDTVDYFFETMTAPVKEIIKDSLDKVLNRVVLILDETENKSTVKKTSHTCNNKACMCNKNDTDE